MDNNMNEITQTFFGPKHRTIAAIFDEADLVIPFHLRGDKRIASKIISLCRNGEADVLKSTLMVCGICDDEKQAEDIANILTQKIGSPIKKDIVNEIFLDPTVTEMCNKSRIRK